MPDQNIVHWSDLPWKLLIIIEGIFGPFVYQFLKGYWKQLQQEKARNWPSVEGHVKATSVRRTLTGHDDGPFHIAKLCYTYSANGQEYGGQLCEKFRTAEEAGKFLHNLQQRPVTIAYNPQKPSKSLVIPEAAVALPDLPAPATSMEEYKEMPSG